MNIDPTNEITADILSRHKHTNTYPDNIPILIKLLVNAFLFYILNKLYKALLIGKTPITKLILKLIIKNILHIIIGISLSVEFILGLNKNRSMLGDNLPNDK